MPARIWLALLLLGSFLFLLPAQTVAPACCPAPSSGKAVVNADQTVLLIWDAATKTQHFIRQASFKSEANDFGFIVPTPSQPELAESGNEAFPFLRKLTEPERIKVARPSRGIGCGCSTSPPTVADAAPQSKVAVLESKLVAGFDAVVLEAESANALALWLKEHGYAFSAEVEKWAEPYVGTGWKFTALKVAKDTDGKEEKTVETSALRLSFKTDTPVFPYREPDPKQALASLQLQRRLLRIYFIADARYQGEFVASMPWQTNVAWANPIHPESYRVLLEMLNIPTNSDRSGWWLTEFEHDWPYAVAPGDVYFTRAADQSRIKRSPIEEYAVSPYPSDVTVLAFAAIVMVPVVRRIRRGRRDAP